MYLLQVSNNSFVVVHLFVPTEENVESISYVEDDRVIRKNPDSSIAFDVVNDYTKATLFRTVGGAMRIAALINSQVNLGLVKILRVNRHP